MGFGSGVITQRHPVSPTPHPHLPTGFGYGVATHCHPPCPRSVPEAAVPLPPPGPSLRGPQLGAQPLTRTRRAAALRDTEDEIFTL